MPTIGCSVTVKIVILEFGPAYSDFSFMGGV